MDEKTRETLHHILFDRPDVLTMDESRLVAESLDAISAASTIWPLTSDSNHSGRTDAMLGLMFLALGEDESVPVHLLELVEADRYLQRHHATHYVGAKRPTRALIPTDKVNEKLFIKEKNGNYKIGVGRDKSGKDVIVKVNISELPSGLTRTDQDVYLACGALWLAGNAVVSPSQIAATLGWSHGKIPDIIKSVDKMRRTFVDINNTAEHVAFGRVEYIRKTYLLPCEMHTAFINGRECLDSVLLFSMPPMVEYAQLTRQVQEVPSLAMRGKVSEKNIKLRAYIRRRVLAKRMTPFAKWSTILKDTGTDDPKHKGRVRNQILAVFQELQADGTIYGYESDDRGVYWFKTKAAYNKFLRDKNRKE